MSHRWHRIYKPTTRWSQMAFRTTFSPYTRVRLASIM